LGPLALGHGGQEFSGDGVVLLVEIRASLGDEGVGEQGAGGGVGNVVAQTSQHGDLHLRLRHQGSALGDLLDSGENLVAESQSGRSHEVEQGCVALYDVGGVPAAVQIGVVHSGGGDDVLAQVVDADVHQLAGVQGA